MNVSKKIVFNFTGLLTKVPRKRISVCCLKRSGAICKYNSNILTLPRFVSNRGSYEYNLIVVGGGSGGLACAKAAAKSGARVLVLDYVTPSQQGSMWGLGGTCVNVGCIPKKLMHRAAIIGESLKEAKQFGWDVEMNNFSWESLVEAVQDYIKSLNWNYRIDLKQSNVDYLNALGSFVDKHTLKTVDKKGQEKQISAEYIVLAVGGRPYYPDIPGAIELGITSDDIFSLQRIPGKTAVVGAGYVALECAGFLRSFGFSVEVLIRSVPLRQFDQQMAGLVVKQMENMGIKFHQKCEPALVEKTKEGRLLLTWKFSDGSTEQGVFDTVLFATGRTAVTDPLNLNKVGVDVDKKTKKVIAKNEQTSVHNIYAVGDILEGKPELTPVAIKAGRLLAERLFFNSKEQMNYDNVPTTVFTPLEYSFCGLSEEQAKQKYKEDNIEVYHSSFTPLEFTVPGLDASNCYTKAVCKREDPQAVVGIHYVGPNAGEIMQGYAVAMRSGLTYKKLSGTVGIHPTCAEEIVRLFITKRSGILPRSTGC